MVAEAQPAMHPIWRPHKGPQTWLLACPVQEIFYGGARGGGKTDGALVDFAQHAQRYGDHARGILFRRTYPELEDVTRRASELYLPIRCAYSKVDRTWTFPNGSTLKLRYLDQDTDADHYQGQQYTWMCFEEAGNWPNPEPLDKLRACLRSADGVPVRLLLTGNPGGVGHAWLKRRYVDASPPLRPFRDEMTGAERVFIPAKVDDNPTLLRADPGYKDRLRNAGPGWLVAAWLHGDWSGPPDGGYFKAEHLRSYAGEPPDELEARYLTVDLAGQTRADNDNTAILAGGQDAKGHVWILPKMRIAKLTSLESAKAILDLADDYDVDAVLIEHGQYQIGLMPFLEQLMHERVEAGTGKLHHFEIMPTKTHGATGKKGRAMGLLAMMEAGYWHFPQSELYETLIKPHFLSFTGESGTVECDDEIDACAHLALFLNQMARGRVREKPKDKTHEVERARWKEIRRRRKADGEDGDFVLMKGLDEE